MFSLHDRSVKLCDRLSRRELMRIGGLNLLGLSLPALLHARSKASLTQSKDPTFGRAKNVIFLYLQGGPPQHETFDPKPDAPVEIRGAFQPIATNVPGIHFCELLPRTAALADKLAVVRSMATDDNVHSSSGYWVLTGYKHDPTSAREIKATDWPYLGSIVKMLRPSAVLPALSTVWIPDIMRLNDNVQPAGQTAGFLGPRWNPEKFVCDPSSPDFHIDDFDLQPEIPPLRLTRRESLLKQVERHFATVEQSSSAREYSHLAREAFGVLNSGAAREAFAIEKEPASVRDRYGRSKWGQCVLLGRRLIEAGVRLVHVNWTREPGDTAVDNPMWDTHAQNDRRLKEVLCPQFDVGFSALIEDLDQRGMLDETLVVAIAEFGRTPKINRHAGRDHWGHVFSFAMAGAGIRTAQVYGASDKHGAYPASGRVDPSDFTATLFHLLGIDHETTFTDRLGRALRVTEGEPIHAILGTEPATMARTAPGGDLSLVPAFDESLLVNLGFESATPLKQSSDSGGTTGWQAMPIAGAGQAGALAVSIADEPAPLSRSGGHHAVIGYGTSGDAGAFEVPAEARAVLLQELRNARAGRFTFAVHAGGSASSVEHYNQVFLKHFTCRLVIFGFADGRRDPARIREFASATFQPPYAAAGSAAYGRFEVSAALRSQDDGAFETSLGVGVAVVVEKTTPGVLNLRPSAGQPPAKALIRIDDTKLDYVARPRDETVKI